MATNLALAFHGKGVSVDYVMSKTETHAKELAERVGARFGTSAAQIPEDADIILYAVRDESLSDILHSVNRPNALHLHTAGSVGIEVFDPQLHPHSGVFYPFQSISKVRILDFTHIPIFIESSDESDVARIKHLAEQITDLVYCADSDTRRSLHLAGVFANNFTNCMYSIAADILADKNLPQEVLYSLIDETAAKIHTLTPDDAQTGPARRNDTAVMQKHLSMLPPELQNVYKSVSEIIISKYHNN